MSAQFEPVIIDEHDRLYGPTMRRIRPSESLAGAAPAGPESESENEPAPPPDAPDCGDAPTKNQAREVWARYATCLGVTVKVEDGRDAIIALVERRAEEN